MSLNNSPYLLELFSPMPCSLTPLALVLRYTVPQLVPAARWPRSSDIGPSESAASRPPAPTVRRQPTLSDPRPLASRPLASAVLRLPALPAKARTREPRFVKLIALLGVANLITLEGKQNYQAWFDQIAIVFKASGIHKVILEGAELPL